MNLVVLSICLCVAFAQDGTYWRYVPLNSLTIRDIYGKNKTATATNVNDQEKEESDGNQWWKFVKKNRTTSAHFRPKPAKLSVLMTKVKKQKPITVTTQLGVRSGHQETTTASTATLLPNWYVTAGHAKETTTQTEPSTTQVAVVTSISSKAPEKIRFPEFLEKITPTPLSVPTSSLPPVTTTTTTTTIPPQPKVATSSFAPVTALDSTVTKLISLQQRLVNNLQAQTQLQRTILQTLNELKKSLAS